MTTDTGVCVELIEVLVEVLLLLLLLIVVVVDDTTFVERVDGLTLFDGDAVAVLEQEELEELEELVDFAGTPVPDTLAEYITVVYAVAVLEMIASDTITPDTVAGLDVDATGTRVIVEYTTVRLATDEDEDDACAVAELVEVEDASAVVDVGLDVLEGGVAVELDVSVTVTETVAVADDSSSVTVEISKTVVGDGVDVAVAVIVAYTVVSGTDVLVAADPPSTSTTE